MSDFTFAQVPRADIPRSTFNRSHGYKTTFDSGLLVPIYVDEALPGDTFKLSVHMFARLITPLFPIMDNLHLDVFFFAVPNRLVWSNWQRFNGEQPNPGDSTDFEVPYVDSGATGFAEGSIFDYMGLPTKVPNLQVNALPLRAYNLVYNEWFRDQNLMSRLPVPLTDGPDNINNYNENTYGDPLMKRCKRHDYFTSALPWPQKGDPVSLPLGTTAPVLPAGDFMPTFWQQGGSTLDYGPLSRQNSLAGAVPVDHTLPTGSAVGANPLLWLDPKLQADLTNATSATINALREAFQIQKLLERDARGGTRYTEILRSHFGVVSPDARLQRPEFLGGDSIPVIINPVAQTSGTAPGGQGYSDTPQGNLAAFGQSSGRAGFVKSFTEHTYILGLIMARADLSYQQGLHKMWTRKSRYDFYWPALAHLGEQPVYNQEIYAQDGTISGDTGNLGIFGYQERWAEYRYAPSKITGKFRSNATGTLDAWHLAQNFTSLPVLNTAFIVETPPVKRITIVQDEPEFLFDSHFRVECTRPMPTYSVPGLIDHF